MNPTTTTTEVTWTPSFTLSIDDTGHVVRIVADWMGSIGDTATRDHADHIEELSTYDLTGRVGDFVRNVTGYQLQQMLRTEDVEFA